MHRLSKGLILHGIRTYSGTEEAELHIVGSQCKAEGRKFNFTSWGMMAEWKSGSGTSAIWQSWQSGSAEAELYIFWQLKQSVSGEAELQIFSSQGRTEVRKRNFTSSAVPTEMKCGWTFTSLEVLIEKVRKRNLRSFEVLAEQKCRERNFTPLEVLAERKCENWTSDLGSQSRTEVRKRNFTSLEELAEQKCGTEPMPRHG